MKIEVFGKELSLNEELVEEGEADTRRQLEGFLNGERSSFDFKLRLPESREGEILRELEKIPYGETLTYSDLSDRVGSSPIAVGQACKRNPLPLIIPCHRAVAKNGLGGYQAGKETKRMLLELEE